MLIYYNWISLERHAGSMPETWTLTSFTCENLDEHWPILLDDHQRHVLFVLYVFMDHSAGSKLYLWLVY